MKAIYTVTNIDQEYITVIEQNPLNPQKNIAELKIKNLRSFDLHLGSHVYIGFPRQLEAFYGILGLFFPILTAVAGYFFGTKLTVLTQKEPSEILKALLILAFFSAGTIVVLFCSRKLPVKMQIQITGVID